MHGGENGVLCSTVACSACEERLVGDLSLSQKHVLRNCSTHHVEDSSSLLVSIVEGDGVGLIVMLWSLALVF